eukprot:Clim_evm79s22 gene=Clim_evmTU79s22
MVAPGAYWNYLLSTWRAFEPAMNVIDLDPTNVTPANIATVQSQGGFVICYFSAGTAEDWRDDYNDFPSSAIGNSLPSWPGEKYIDIRQQSVVEIMYRRLDSMAAAGCDGTEPDNVDVFNNNSGFNLSKQDAAEYVTKLANYAHGKGMQFALKNAPSLISDVLSVSDFAVVEQCVQYNFCDDFDAFISAGKPVFAIEYSGSETSICNSLLSHGFSGIKKDLNLDQYPLTVCTSDPDNFTAGGIYVPDSKGSNYVKFTTGKTTSVAPTSSSTSTQTSTSTASSSQTSSTTTSTTSSDAPPAGGCNEYTVRGSGAECWFARGTFNCAVCKNGGCQCGSSNPNACVKCGRGDDCERAPACGGDDNGGDDNGGDDNGGDDNGGDDNGGDDNCTLNEWTESSSGARCYFDSGRFDCAKCAAGGCQCGSGNHRSCVQCGRGGDCDSAPQCN